MPQDAFTLRHLCVELNDVFKGGKVNRIVQPSSDEVIITVYTGKRTEKLTINVDPSSPRISVMDSEKASPLTAPNFCMLLRKHLLSATITSVELVGFDRIVKIEFLSSAEFFDAVKKTMYVELMGRYSNVILTENGKILGGNRGINMFDDGVRPLIVGQPYVFPPVGDKKLPTDNALISVFNNVQKQELAKTIISNVQGVALSTAEEIVFLYFEGCKDATKIEDGNAFFVFFNDFLYAKKTQPCVLKNGAEITDVCAYPYATLSGEKIFFPTLIKAEEFYFENKDKQKQFKCKKERLTAVTNTAIKKAKKRVTAIKAKKKDALGAEENKIKGELLLANIYAIKNGQGECELLNYYDNSMIKISLDSRLSVAKNAEVYYKKYNKQKRTLIALQPQLDQAESELSYYESVMSEIELCEDINELALVQTELENAGVLVDKQARLKLKKENESFCRVYDVEGFRVLVGRNNAENDKLTFTAKPEDVWVHAKDYHSSHVIIESQKRSVPQSVIETSAEICAYYSKGREGGKTEIVYTQKKNVKKPPKSKPGLVIYENFKSISVNPNKRLELLK